MSKVKIDKSMPKRRSIPAISLKNFRSTSFHHKTEERGGSTNEMAGYMSEYAEYQEDNAEEVSFLDLE
jgi:hypothetical protein